MATLPTLTLRAALGASFGDSAPTWTDLSAYVRRGSTRRGRQRLQRTQAQFQAGTATIALRNTDRRFDPTNTAGPYWPNLQPGTLINLQATWSGTTYDLFTGYVDNWSARWPGGTTEGETTLVSSDLFGILAKRRILNARYAEAVLADGPRCYWKLNDPNGSAVALDYSGSHRDAQVADATLGASGLLVSADGAAAFDGTQTVGIVAPAGSEITGTGPWTVEAWVQAGTLHSGQSTIFQQRNSTGSDYIKLTVWDDGDVQLEWAHAGSKDFLRAPSTVNDGNVHHIVATFSPAEVDVCVDGTHILGFTPAPVHDIAAGVVTIGKGADYPFAGSIAHVAFYPSYLDIVTVGAHYQAGIPFVQQSSGHRVGAVLDALGFPSSWRRVDDGHTTVPVEAGSLLTTASLAYLQRVEQAEQGQLLMGPDGYVEFHNRYGRYGQYGAANQATFGDGAGELPYPTGAFGIDYDALELFNIVPVARSSGQTQVAAAQASIDAIGERTAAGFSGVMLTSDLAALGLGQWVVADTQSATYRIDSLILDPRADSNLWPHALGRKINDVVTVNKHNVPGGGSAISLASRIEGIDHTWGDSKWQTAFHLSEMGTGKWLILDDPTCDALDGTNRLGW